VYRNAAVVGATLHGALLINTNHIMAVGKKSFVLYSDLLVSIEHLTNEEKGMLFNHLLEYVNDKNPVLTDRLLITAWKPIEMQLKRDLKKFEEVKVKRSEAGKASAEARALKLAEQEQTKSTSVESVQRCSTNSTDNVNDTVNVNVNVNENVIKEKRPTSGFDFKYSLIQLGVEKQVAEDWLKVRAKHKASNTQTAFNKIAAEINKSGRDANWCITKAVEKSWRGFEAEWVKPEPVKVTGHPPVRIAL
jgi:hypothetical protein